jgi:hypothetical protein
MAMGVSRLERASGANARAMANGTARHAHGHMAHPRIKSGDGDYLAGVVLFLAAAPWVRQ